MSIILSFFVSYYHHIVNISPVDILMYLLMRCAFALSNLRNTSGILFLFVNKLRADENNVCHVLYTFINNFCRYLVTPFTLPIVA